MEFPDLQFLKLWPTQWTAAETLALTIGTLLLGPVGYGIGRLAQKKLGTVRWTPYGVRRVVPTRWKIATIGSCALLGAATHMLILYYL